MAKSLAESPFKGIRRDKHCGGYLKKLVHKGHEIDVRFEAEGKAELDRLLPAAEKFWKSRVGWFKVFREFSCDELLEALNNCLDSGQGDHVDVTQAQLHRILRAPFLIQFHADEDDPETIVFEMDGGSHEALQEHCFEVFGTLDEGITSGDVVSLF